MLRIAYINTSTPIVRPKKQTKQQEIDELARRLLIKAKVNDVAAAIKNPHPICVRVAELERELEELLAKHDQLHKSTHSV
jgi:hypothetical protein